VRELGVPPASVFVGLLSWRKSRRNKPLGHPIYITHPRSLKTIRRPRLEIIRSITSVESVQGKNQICLLDIDIQGAQKVKKSSLDAHYLFIAPPSMDELETRLRGRGTEKEDAIQRRLSNARGELEYGLRPGNFDAVLVNNDLDKTLQKMVGKFRAWFPELLLGK
jgi:hypothetical protein